MPHHCGTPQDHPATGQPRAHIVMSGHHRKRSGSNCIPVKFKGPLMACPGGNTALLDRDAANDVVLVGAAPAPLGWLYYQVLAPQHHLEQVALSLVVGGVPPLPPMRAACAQ